MTSRESSCARGDEVQESVDVAVRQAHHGTLHACRVEVTEERDDAFNLALHELTFDLRNEIGSDFHLLRLLAASGRCPPKPDRKT